VTTIVANRFNNIAIGGNLAVLYWKRGKLSSGQRFG
jgi:hypothetical protein